MTHIIYESRHGINTDDFLEIFTKHKQMALHPNVSLIINKTSKCPSEFSKIKYDGISVSQKWFRTHPSYVFCVLLLLLLQCLVSDMKMSAPLATGFRPLACGSSITRWSRCIQHCPNELICNVFVIYSMGS